MATRLDVPQSYAQGMDFGGIGHIAEFMPQLATLLSTLPMDIGQHVRNAIMPGAVGGAMGRSPAATLFDRQQQSAVGNITANLNTSAVLAGVLTQGRGSSSVVDGMLTSFAANQQGVGRFDQLYESSLRRAGVGYIPGAQGGTEVRNVERLFSGLASQTDTQGTMLHERGLVGAMYHRAHRGTFASGDIDTGDVADRVTTLTKALADLADTMGTDLEGAARRLNTTLGMDLTVAFRGVEDRLGVTMALQQEATRMGGLTQGAMAEMIGVAMETGQHFGGRRGGMVAEGAAAVAGVQAARGPAYGYGIDSNSYGQAVTERTAAVATSPWARTYSGIFALAQEADPELTLEQFIAETEDTSDIREISRMFGLGDRSMGVLKSVGYSAVAEQAMMDPSAIHRASLADVDQMEENISGFMGRLLGVDLSKGRNRELFESVVRSPEGAANPENLQKLIDGLGVKGITGTQLEGMLRRYGDRSLDEGWDLASDLMADRAGRQEAYEVAKSRSRTLAAQERMGGGVTGLINYLEQADDGTRMGEALSAFFGVADITDIVGEAGGEELGALFRDIYGGAEGGDRRALRGAFGELSQDLGTLSEEEQAKAIKDVFAAMEEGDITGVLDTIRGHTVRGRREDRREGLLKGLGGVGEGLDDQAQLRLGALLESAGEGIDAEDLMERLGDWDPYTRQFENEEKVRREKDISEELFEKARKEAHLAEGPLQGLELVVELLKDVIAYLAGEKGNIPVKEKDGE